MTSRFVLPLADVGAGLTPSSGAQLFFYETGTTTPKDTYSDSAGTTPNANPVVANSVGVFPDIFISGTYKVVLKNSDGIQQWAADPITEYAISSDNEFVKNFATLADAVADTNINEGDAVNLAERTTGNGGWGIWDVVLASGVTTNSYNIVQCTGVATLALVLRVEGTANVKQFGAVGDGVTDDTAALEAISTSLADGDTVDFGSGTYLISKTGFSANVSGHRIFDLNGKSNITFKGEGATIKCVNHDVSTNNGLSFIWAVACPDLTVDGIDFDMTFTGINTSASYYPFCGGIMGIDSSADGQGSALNRDWNVKNCSFKLYHPKGQYAQSGAAYLGDGNNGFKVFPCFVSGPYLATAYINQSRNITIDNCILKDGHNGYGFWAWAWNNVTVTRCTAESFVGKQSSAAGVISGRGEPMIRYHQFYCEGLKVTDNHFRAKPCDERLVAGFEGFASFVNAYTNLTGDFSHGNCEITGNTIIGGGGDAAAAAAAGVDMSDWLIFLYAYGGTTICDNTFSSNSVTSNLYGEVGIFWNSESSSADDGTAGLNISDNVWTAKCDAMQNIVIANGEPTAAGRRLKSLSVTDNISLAQLQYFLSVSTTNTAFGVQDTLVSGNLVSGEFNTIYDKNNTNSRALSIAGSEATDICTISNNTIRDKYYGILPNSYAGIFIEHDNTMTGVTERFDTTSPAIQTLTGAGAVSVTTATTWLVTTGADALTLAAGVEGQSKTVIMKTDGGTGTLTPSNLGNGTTITFDDVGDSAQLLFTNAAWYFMGGTATLA